MQYCILYHFHIRPKRTKSKSVQITELCGIFDFIRNLLSLSLFLFTSPCQEKESTVGLYNLFYERSLILDIRREINVLLFVGESYRAIIELGPSCPSSPSLALWQLVVVFFFLL